MCPLSYYQIMRNCKDKRAHRYQMVQYALSNGVKPAARIFSTSPPVVRKWLTRFKEHGYHGLLDLSRKPHHSPAATPEAVKDHIVDLRKKKYHRLGARQVKTLEYLPQAEKTIRKIWRDAGVARGRRKKKYITKQNLREVKKQFYLFQQSCEDTKDLFDIPEYWPQMKRLNLPTSPVYPQRGKLRYTLLRIRQRTLAHTRNALCGLYQSSDGKIQGNA